MHGRVLGALSSLHLEGVIVLLIQSVIRPARLRCPGHEDGHLLAEFTWRRRG